VIQSRDCVYEEIVQKVDEIMSENGKKARQIE
jgi:hypothetical protein